MKTVVITGVSSGIGLDLVREFATNDYKVFGSVRKEEDAQKLIEKFGDKFYPLILDVTDFKAIEGAVDKVKKEINDTTLTALINNAGIAISGPIIHISEEELKKQFEVNLFGVLAVTKAFLPLLKGANPGRIINISSVSGKNVFPFLGAYAASKHALEAISDALRRELALYGIKTILIEPGSTKSAIWEKVPHFAEYKHTDFYLALGKVFKIVEKSLQNILPVEKVSKVIFKALERKNPKTRYVIVHNKLTNWLIPRYLPDKVLDKIFFKMMYK